jgi:hypothetical protein
MTELDGGELWFAAGAQELYGPAVLRAVAEHTREQLATGNVVSRSHGSRPQSSAAAVFPTSMRREISVARSRQPPALGAAMWEQSPVGRLTGSSLPPK